MLRSKCAKKYQTQLIELQMIIKLKYNEQK